MSIDAELHKMRGYRVAASQQFRDQIERVDRARRDLGLGGIDDVPVADAVGIDRSSQLMPVERPLLHTRAYNEALVA